MAGAGPDPYTGGETGGLNALLRSLARRTSDGWIAIITGVGLAGVTLVSLFAWRLWKLAFVFLVIAAFGAWGIADRSTIRPNWLASASLVAAAAIGAIGAFVVLFSAIEFVLVSLRS